MTKPIDLIQRHPGNPILTPEDVPYPVETVHNAAAARFEDRVILLFRSHLRNGRSILGLAESHDGFHFEVAPTPFMVPASEGIFAEYETFGVEDPRITPIDGEYYITYSAYSPHGVRIGLARTRDFKTVERLAFISETDMRNVVLFPERFDGRYARLDRPHSQIDPWSIWLSWSSDLIHWGEAEVVMKPLKYHWDEMKIGPGAPPIRTPRGWLSLYHGVFETMAGAVYRLGVALHELDNPARLAGVSDEWVLSPRDPWERSGYVPNVVFTCGALPGDDGNLTIYWGAADTVLCAGTARIDDLVELCLENPRPPR